MVRLMMSDDFGGEVRPVRRKSRGRCAKRHGWRGGWGTGGKDAGRRFHALVRTDFNKGNLFLCYLFFNDRRRRFC